MPVLLNSWILLWPVHRRHPRGPLRNLRALAGEFAQWWDALNVLPAVAWSVGRAARALSKWACFEAGTPIVCDVLPAEATTVALASAEPRAFDRASLAVTALLVGALASAQAVYDRDRRRLAGPERVRDLFFRTPRGRIDDDAVDALAEGRHRKPTEAETTDHVFSQAWA